MKKFIKYIFTLLFIVLIDCDSINISESAPRVMFLNYNASKGRNGEVNLHLIDKTITKGKVKENSFNQADKFKGEITITQLDKQHQPIESYYIENPLIKDVEYIEPSGLLTKKRIELDSIKFNIRLQLKPNAKFISLQIKNNLETIIINL